MDSNVKIIAFAQIFAPFFRIIQRLQLTLLSKTVNQFQEFRDEKIQINYVKFL